MHGCIRTSLIGPPGMGWAYSQGGPVIKHIAWETIKLNNGP